MRKSSNGIKNRKLREYWADESKREVARQRTLAFWRSKRGKNLKKEMHERKGVAPTTGITTSQLDSGDYIRDYQRRYRNHRVSQDGTPYYIMLARFNQLKKKGEVDIEMRFRDYCKENGIEFKTLPITWNGGN